VNLHLAGPWLRAAPRAVTLHMVWLSEVKDYVGHEAGAHQDLAEHVHTSAAHQQRILLLLI